MFPGRTLLLSMSLLALGLIGPSLARAQTHGLGLFQNSLGPSGLPSAHVGDLITTTLRVVNYDTFGDSAILTNIQVVVHHGIGDFLSSNLIGTPVFLPNLNDHVDVTYNYPVFPNDPDLLRNDALAKAQDNHDGSGGTGIPQSIQYSFPAQVRILRPAIGISRACNGGGTYSGSISNTGNTPLVGVVVSNFVSGAFGYVLGPTNLDVGMSILFTNSSAGQCGSEGLFVWGRDELDLVVSNSVVSAPAVPTISIIGPTNEAKISAPLIIPTSITITPATSTPVGMVVRVCFFANGNYIGSSTTSPFSFTWTNVLLGDYALTSRALNSVCGSAESSPVNIHVTAPIYHGEVSWQTRWGPPERQTPTWATPLPI